MPDEAEPFDSGIRARLEDLPPRRVLALRYEATRPLRRGEQPPELAAHWQRFHDLRLSVESAEPGVLAIAYTPPGAYGAPPTVLLCIPYAGDDLPAGGGAELRTLPGGAFVLASGEIEQIPQLYAAARGYASGHGLAVERGGIEIYRDAPSGAGPFVDAGYRIHT